MTCCHADIVLDHLRHEQKYKSYSGKLHTSTCRPIPFLGCDRVHRWLARRRGSLLLSADMIMMRVFFWLHGTASMLGEPDSYLSLQRRCVQPSRMARSALMEQWPRPCEARHAPWGRYFLFCQNLESFYCSGLSCRLLA